MAKKTSSWLIGCGVGCGLIVVAIIGLALGGTMYLKKLAGGFDRADAGRRVIEKEFGKPADFTPAPDGAVPADRLEAFLEVREASEQARKAVLGHIENLPVSESQAKELDSKPFFEKLVAVFSIGKSAFGMAARMGDLLASRNDALLQAKMGMGEYTYIYAVSYYSFLGHSPTDGPTSARREDRPSHGDFEGHGTRSRIHSDLIAMLKNQLASLPPDAESPFKAALASEIDAMEKDSGRYPWQDDLPDAIRASLEPYRDRLEALYEPATNPFELARTRKRGRMSYTAD